MHALVIFSEETQGGSNINWLLWVALVFFVAMVVTGWLAKRNKKQDSEINQDHQEHQENH